MIFTQDVQSRFDRRVQKNTDGECWIWTGNRTTDGYGRVQIECVQYLAHRISYERHMGEIPHGLCVLHRCDVRACVNPEHLFLGTRPDNSADMVMKRRQKYGEAAPGAKLTYAQVVAIRSISGRSQKEIAIEFGVDASSISLIRRGIHWKTAPEKSA